MTTVGFGDVVPQSPAAKVLTFCVAVVGLLITAIMITIVNKELELSAAQGCAHHTRLSAPVSRLGPTAGQPPCLVRDSD